MRTASLCTGIGGLDLGVLFALDGEMDGYYCEADPAARAVLEKHMATGHLPYGLVFHDLREVEEPADLLICGFPCQAWSTASRGRPVADKEILPDVLAAIFRTRPEWVFLENPRRAAIERACAGLEIMGYTAARDRFCASELGCPSPRVRWFALAHTDDARELQLTKYEEVAGISEATDVGLYGNNPERLLAVDDGVPRMVAHRLLGNACNPAQAAFAIRSLARRTGRVA